MEASPTAVVNEVEQSKSSEPSSPLTGAALLTEATQNPTLDIYLRNPPNTIKEEDYPQIVGILRHKRELNIAAEQKRKDKSTDDGVTE